MNATLLKKCIAQAPRMEPTDAVKLVYQSEFGCGHLLYTPSDNGEEDPVAERLRSELEQTPLEQSMPAATMIGGGFCRLHLASPAVRALSPEMLARMMRLSATGVQGSICHLEQALELLRTLTQAGETPFSLSELDAYLDLYRKEGYPPVSHSPRYRQAYVPAYRVVLSDFAVLLPVLAALPARIVLDGACGAGKTTLANLLAALCELTPIRMDDFFLPHELRTPQRLGEPGGNVHYERFQSEVLNRLPASAAFDYRRFDCQTGQYEPKVYTPASVLLIEGSYSHHPAFRVAYDRLHVLRVFVNVDAEEQIRRLTLRNVDLLSRFQNEWIPLEKTYFEAYDIKQRANITLQSEPWEDIE